MKKVMFLIIGLQFLLIAFNELNAQMDIGVYAGLNNGKLSGDAPVDAKYASRPGIAAGISLDWWVAEHVALSIQPGFFQEGVKVLYLNSREKQYEDSLNIRINYFNIPLLIKINALSEKFYAIGGFDFEIPLDFVADDGEQEVEINQEFNSLNIAMNFGLGYHIPIKSSTLNIEVRYAQGLGNITDSLDDPKSELPRVKTSSTRLLASWYIPLKKKRID